MKSKRMRLYVERGFQIQVLLYFNALIVLILLLLFFSQLSLTNQLTDLIADPSVRIRVTRQSFTLFGIVGFFTLILTNLIGLLFTHRISGPLFRLKKHLEQAAHSPDKRTSKPLAFRPSDFFQDLPPLVNRVLLKGGDSKGSRD